MSTSPDSDDARTVGTERPSPDVRESAVQMGHVLTPGTLVRDYEISALIGEGGFGIVYLAYDHSLQRAVAMKEYMPSSMASRVAGTSEVRVKSQRHEETFRAGLKSFVNEARLLARFDHPALVKVYRFWEENGTAYMVMPYYEGPTLKSALATRGSPPDETQLRLWLKPLLDALGVMHAAHCFHRDIAPDNILLTPSGPLLLDFGAARRVIGDMTHDLTVVLKPGFAPIEQYGDVATMAQGAWTDLYALACVVYFAITGKVPMSSVERLMDDRLQPLRVVAAGRYSASFLATIDAALAVRPHDRPQTDAEFAALLDGGSPMPASATADVSLDFGPVDATTPAWPKAEPAADIEATAVRMPPRIDDVTRPIARAPSGSAARGQPASADAAPLDEKPAAGSVASRSRRRIAWFAAGAAGLVTVVAIALTGGGGSGAPSEAGATASTATTPVVTTPADMAPVVTAPVTAPVVTAPVTTTPMTPTPVTEKPPAPAPVNGSPVSETPVLATPMTATPANTAPSTETAPSPTAEMPVPRPPPRETASRAPKPSVAATESPSPDKAPVINPKEKAARKAADPSRCSDILQKASLEPLTADEAAYLRRECR